MLNRMFQVINRNGKVADYGQVEFDFFALSSFATNMAISS